MADDHSQMTQREATCQQGMPCGDPGSCPDPIGCGFVEVAGYPADEPDDYPWDRCPTCRGEGTVNPLTAPDGFLAITTTTCPTCEGTGEFL